MTIVWNGVYVGANGTNELVTGGVGGHWIAGHDHAYIIGPTGQLIGGNGGTGGEYGGAGGYGLRMAASGASMVNENLIEGGNGGDVFISEFGYSSYRGGAGGGGIILDQGSSLLNEENIVGGFGGTTLALLTGTTGLGGEGGIGVYAISGENIENFVGASIDGGPGGGGGSDYGADGTYQGGSGGAGVLLSDYGSLDNIGGDILGGQGGWLQGDASGAAGVGGAGVISFDSIVVNVSNGDIYGGEGGGIDGTANSGTAGNGGYGVYIYDGELENSGKIQGGLGGYGARGPAGAGGTGVVAKYGVVVSNRGVLTGGVGGVGAVYSGNGGGGGEGGIGLDLTSDGTLTNHQSITGGAGGYGETVGGTGGEGLNLLDAAAFNLGSIAGGAGGLTGENGGAGGAGVYSTYGSLTNTGTIKGGAGVAGTGLFGGSGGAGGNGVDLLGGTLDNTGTIDGGAGANAASLGVTGGNGGDGVFLDGGTLTNAGTIKGGSAGSGGLIAGTAGDAVLFGSVASTLIIDASATFNGNVVANSSVNDVLELSGTAAGMVSGLGTQFTGFKTYELTQGANWTLRHTNTLLAGTSLNVFGSLIDQGILSDAGNTTISGSSALVGFNANGNQMSFAKITLAGGTLRGAVNGKIIAGSTTAAGVKGEILVTGTSNSITGNGNIGGVVLVDNGAVTAKGGTLTLETSTSGTGKITVDLGANLLAEAGLSVAKIAFQSGTGAENVTLDNPVATTSLFSGFEAGDIINLAGLTVTSMTYASGVLTLFDGTTTVDSLNFSGSYTLSNFTHTAISGGTAIGYHS